MRPLNDPLSIEVKFSENDSQSGVSMESSPSDNDVAVYAPRYDRANAYRILEETLNLKDIRNSTTPSKMQMASRSVS